MTSETNTEKTGFAALGISSPELLENIGRLGFSEPTQIQLEVIPLALQPSDVSGLSRTGTGKTCAFLIPVIDRLLTKEKGTYALCLAPTRELAIQIEAEAKKLCQGLPIRPVSLVGGMPAADQIREMRGGARLIVGTPGRVMDLIRNRLLDPAQVQILVFDEADRMFDMGFIDDMRFILERVNPERQILLFSATMNFSVLNMMYEFRCNPVEVNVSKDQLTADGIEQMIYHVSEREKPAYLVKFCNEVKEGGIIIFVNYREKVHWVEEVLNANGIPATGISSLLRQDKRNRIIQGFKAGSFRALVATDVASRGIDVDGVALVVNYQLPDETANYVHRIGRTARAGKSGKAISIAGPDDGYNQIRIEEFIGNKIPIGWLAQEDIPAAIQMPQKNRGFGRMNRDSNWNDRNTPAPSRPSHIAAEPQSEPMDAPEAAAEENNSVPALEAPRRPAPRNAGHRDSRRGNDGRGRGGQQRHPDSSTTRDRPERNDRPERADRPERGPHQHAGRGGSRDHRDQRNYRNNNSRRQSPEGELEQKPALPYPISGAPVIYCTRTGKVKANPANAPQGPSTGGSTPETERRSSLLSKIGSTVSSIFSKR